MSGWQLPNARTIRHSETFESQTNELHSDVQRLDKVLMGVEWGIATNPEIFPEIRATRLRLALTNPAPEIPPLRIFFTIDDEDYCTLQWIEEIPQEERNDEGT